MKSRSLVTAAAVVGALIVGGATTGTTLALWRGQATMPGHTAQAGSIGLTVNQSVDVGLGTLTMQPGESRAIPLTFTNTGQGKNLRLIASVSEINTSNNAEVPLSFGFRSMAPGDTCTAASTGLTTYTGSSLPLTGPLNAGESTTACMLVTMTRTALPTAEQTSTVTLTFTGNQVRP